MGANQGGMEGRRLGRAACDAKSISRSKPAGRGKRRTGGGRERGRPATLLRSAFVFHGIVRRTRTHRSVVGNSNDFSSAAGGFSARRSPRWTPIRTAGRRHGDRRVGRMPRSGMIRRPAVPARPAWRRLGVRGAVAANDGRRRPMRRHHAHAEAIRGCARAARQPALSRIATGVSSRARPGVSLQVDATRNASPLAGRRPSGRLSK